MAVLLLVVVLSTVRILAIDVGLAVYFPFWSRLPLQFSLALGPMVFFYVLKLTWPEYEFRTKDILHFSPLLLELGAHALAVRDSIKTNVPAYNTLTFHQLNPILQLLAFISVITYLYLSHWQIERYYRGFKFNGGDRYRSELRWLHNLLMGFGLLYLLWALFTITDEFLFHHRLGIHAYYPFHLLFAAMIIWMAAAVHLSAVADVPAGARLFPEPLLPQQLKQKGAWLKKAMKSNRYYEDPEVSLNTLAEKLGLTPHELSRIINTVLKKKLP